MKSIVIIVIIFVGIWLISWINESNPGWKFADLLPFSKTLPHAASYNIGCLFVLLFFAWRVMLLYRKTVSNRPAPGNLKPERSGALAIAKVLGAVAIVIFLFYLRRNTSLGIDFFDILPLDVDCDDRRQIAAFATFGIIVLMAAFTVRVLCSGARRPEKPAAVPRIPAGVMPRSCLPPKTSPYPATGSFKGTAPPRRLGTPPDNGRT
jgi:hypothetical protein